MDNTFTIALTATQTLALAALAVLIGHILVGKIKFFSRFNFPDAIIGGFLVAIILYILQIFSVHFSFDKTFQEPLMIAFFSSIGFSASWRSLKAGGRAVFVFFGLSVLALVLQGGLGVIIAQGLDLPLIAGILTGPVALTGGPGTALAFAPMFEQSGLAGASTLGLAAALGGILLGGLVGTPVSTILIEKMGRHKTKNVYHKAKDETLEIPKPIFGFSMKNIFAMIFMIGIGSFASKLISDTGVTLPVYIGAMLVAAILRNWDDYTNHFELQEDKIEEIGGVALALFVALATSTLDFSKLVSSAFSLVVFLTLQTALVVSLAYWLIPKFCGKDYESAVIAGGFIGFMMGTTANAMANMNAISKKYGPSPRAFLVVPLVGACFIDFVNAALVTMAVTFLK
jgi:ESS family glutamate:Na+ symporter